MCACALCVHNTRVCMCCMCCVCCVYTTHATHATQQRMRVLAHACVPAFPVPASKHQPAPDRNASARCRGATCPSPGPGADLTGAALELCPMDGAILRNAILEGAGRGLAWLGWLASLGFPWPGLAWPGLAWPATVCCDRWGAWGGGWFPPGELGTRFFFVVAKIACKVQKTITSMRKTHRGDRKGTERGPHVPPPLTKLGWSTDNWGGAQGTLLCNCNIHTGKNLVRKKYVKHTRTHPYTHVIYLGGGGVQADKADWKISLTQNRIIT